MLFIYCKPMALYWVLSRVFPILLIPFWNSSSGAPK